MVKGIHARMPVANSSNVPMTSIMVYYILKAMDIKFAAPKTGHDRRIRVVLTGAYFVITFGYSLQLNEGFWVDADHICQHIEVGKTDGRSPHLIVPMLRRFEGDDG